MHNYLKVIIISLQVNAGKLKSVICPGCTLQDHRERPVCITALKEPHVNYHLFWMSSPWKIISTLKKRCLFSHKHGDREKTQRRSNNISIKHIYKRFSFQPLQGLGIHNLEGIRRAYFQAGVSEKIFKCSSKTKFSSHLWRGNSWLIKKQNT